MEVILFISAKLISNKFLFFARQSIPLIPYQNKVRVYNSIAGT